MAKKDPQEFINEDEQDQIEEPSPKQDQTILDEILSKDVSEMIPWEEVNLPSGGLFYDNELMQSGVVRVRGMDFSIEKVLANQRLAKDGQALDIMFEKCVELPDPEFDYMDLLFGDRNFLMFYIRGATYGDEYDFSLECPHCQHQDIYSFNLSELLTTMKISTKEEAANYPFRVVLPHLSKMMNKPIDVGVRIITGKDMARVLYKNRPDKNRMFKRARVRKKIEPVRGKDGNVYYENKAEDTRANDVIKMSIVDVCGDKNPTKLDTFIKKLHSKDLSVISQFIDKMSPGIDTFIEVPCVECENTIGPIMLPMQDTFFRTIVR